MTPARQRVVLYNPQAPFFTMPLALVALGSCLDPTRYEVRIVDGRLEADPVSAVLGAIDGAEAVCLGVSVLTGAPIRDALEVTAAVRARRPRLPVVWGGWHPSLFPQESLTEAGLDAVVIGQGEAPFVEIVRRLADGASLVGIPGTAVRAGIGNASAAGASGPPQPLVDVNRLPAHDYRLIPVERYFALKGRRQLDYVSSQGCRFRCTFCADPSVYRRSWTGLDAARVGRELAWLARRYGVRDVGFQDETFFTSTPRVAAIAEEFLRRDLEFTWMATMRADQGCRLDGRVLATCRRAGLRRVMIGVEAGSQPMLDWMKKDITVDQVLDAASKCARLDIAVLFNLVVGFPGESAKSLDDTLRLAKRLRAMRPDFEVAIFHYRPYPGNPITDGLVRDGVRLPRTLDEWAAFEDAPGPSPWVDRRTFDLVERFRFYQRIGWARSTPLRMPLQVLARWRCRRDFYVWPFERTLVAWLRPRVGT